MPGVVSTALTVALETADGVGDTDGVDKDGVRITRWVMSLNVRERYSPDERGERVTGVSNNSVSNASDSNGSDSIKLKLSEWCDDRKDILELKELGERGLRGGGVNGIAMTRGLALPVTVLKEPVDIIRDNDTRTLGRWPFRSCPFGRSSLNEGATFEGMTVVLCVDKRDGSVGTSSKMGSSKRDRLSKISDPKEMEDAVETEDGVLVNATWDRSGVSMGDKTVVEDGARREGEGTVGGALGDRDGVADAETDIDTVPAGDGDGSAGAETDIDTIASWVSESDSRRPMGEGPGKDGGTELMDPFYERPYDDSQGFLSRLRGKDANDLCKVEEGEGLGTVGGSERQSVIGMSTKVETGINAGTMQFPDSLVDDIDIDTIWIIADSDYSKAIITEFHYHNEDRRQRAAWSTRVTSSWSQVCGSCCGWPIRLRLRFRVIGPKVAPVTGVVLGVVLDDMVTTVSLRAFENAIICTHVQHPSLLFSLHPFQNHVRVPSEAVGAQLVSVASSVMAVPEDKKNAPVVSALKSTQKSTQSSSYPLASTASSPHRVDPRDTSTLWTNTHVRLPSAATGDCTRYKRDYRRKLSNLLPGPPVLFLTLLYYTASSLVLYAEFP
ncbi:hypothetical protein EDB85DRAFT_1886660 [Lactarius pseudohatsudake]|nr:hypothetical protein EDB85DRAFT_1886660 [Lactarius pseudohatsudake]